jgi:hypothetical protein
MQLSNRISVLADLGNLIRKNLDSDRFQNLIEKAHDHNGWFTKDQIHFALTSIAEKFLHIEKLEKWISAYQIPTVVPKNVGLILAGNIPLVGFHDVMSVFVSGHHASIKYSSKDRILIPLLIELLAEINSETSGYFSEVNDMKKIDALIATGSDNTSRYFEYYFRNHPHIIRKNRTSVAILSGKESAWDINQLSFDIFRYFGLGCRNVSKLFVPSDFNPVHFLDQLTNPFEVQNHFKYSNNYVYNRTILLMKRSEHLDNGFILLKEDSGLHPPLSVIYYEKYNTVPDLKSSIDQIRGKIQIVVSKEDIPGISAIPFGNAQQPELWDYADGVDTLKFLSKL